MWCREINVPLDNGSDGTTEQDQMSETTLAIMEFFDLLKDKCQELVSADPNIQIDNDLIHSLNHSVVNPRYFLYATDSTNTPPQSYGYIGSDDKCSILVRMRRPEIPDTNGRTGWYKPDPIYLYQWKISSCVRVMDYLNSMFTVKGKDIPIAGRK